MIEKMVVVAILFALLFAADRRALRQAGRTAGWLYGTLAACAIYLGAVYITERPWPNLNTVTEALYGWPARALFGLFK